MQIKEQTAADRGDEFDQTKRHEYPVVYSRNSVSPAIWEHRYLQEKQARKMAEERLSVALDRIRGYERINNALAIAVDEMESSFKTLTGKSPDEFKLPL